MSPRRSSSLVALVAIVTGLSGCAGPLPTIDDSIEAKLQAAWVELGPQPQVRAVVNAGAGCPALSVDGRTLPMALRVGPGTPAPRSAAKPGDPAKPSLFPIEVCEAALPRGTLSVSVAGRALPVPSVSPRRIVVLGDSGCRLKGTALQDCNDIASWPFARVAAAAAALAPDLVVHVGDYHYRETPCPAGYAGCEGSPWGYGWDTWQADFFVPAAPLLAAAPWVFVRGNHEECARAGQGWHRLLAPDAYSASRSCDDPNLDDAADFSQPYAVPLGSDAQLLVFDSARAGYAPLDLHRPKDALVYATYQSQLREMAALSEREGVRSWFVSHHPVLGFAPDSRRADATPFPGNAALQSALQSLFGNAYFPPGVQATLHGHVHLFQAISFASKHPATLVAGNGGDSLDESLPNPLPAGIAPAPGTVVEQFTHSSSFGFLLLERDPLLTGEWTVQAYRSDGSRLARCALTRDRRLRC